MSTPVLQVEDLRTHFVTRDLVVRAVDGVSLRVNPGETVGLVGESGCGKTMLALSILRLVPEPGRIVSGRVLVNGQDVLAMDRKALARLRGGDVAMTFQDPMTALNPVMKIGAQIREAMTAHERFTRSEAARRVLPLMQKVRIPSARQRTADYPHQFSGGMRQRVMIAMGVANEPSLLVADEATTALDATAQSQMVDLLRQVNDDSHTAVVLISHNLRLVAGLCQRVVVMYAGQIVEDGEVERVFARPQHPYTWHLLRSVPRADAPRQRRLIAVGGQPPDPSAMPTGCRFHPRCAFREERCVQVEPALDEVEPSHHGRCLVLGGDGAEAARAHMRAIEAADPLDGSVPPAQERRQGDGSAVRGNEVLLMAADLRQHYRVGWFGGRVATALDGVSLEVRRGETLGLIGESGCGKSTLALALARLVTVESGRIFFNDEEVTSLEGAELRDLRRRLQVVFQDPMSSLDPRLTVGSSVREPLDNFRVGGRDERNERVARLLELVRLNPAWANRYPHELSGGQRQRVGIARALALDPHLVICDEPVSALDVSIQAQILNLLTDLQEELGLTYVFISHDLGVIRQMADRIAVMYLGRIIEVGDADGLFRNPRHPYTRALLESVPIRDPSDTGSLTLTGLEGEPASALEIPQGCRFHPRCSLAEIPGICEQQDPPLEPHGPDRRLAACHFANETPLRPVAFHYGGEAGRSR